MWNPNNSQNFRHGRWTPEMGDGQRSATMKPTNSNGFTAQQARLANMLQLGVNLPKPSSMNKEELSQESESDDKSGLTTKQKERDREIQQRLQKLIHAKNDDVTRQSYIENLDKALELYKLALDDPLVEPLCQDADVINPVDALKKYAADSKMSVHFRVIGETATHKKRYSLTVGTNIVFAEAADDVTGKLTVHQAMIKKMFPTKNTFGDVLVHMEFARQISKPGLKLSDVTKTINHQTRTPKDFSRSKRFTGIPMTKRPDHHKESHDNKVTASDASSEATKDSHCLQDSSTQNWTDQTPPVQYSSAAYEQYQHSYNHAGYSHYDTATQNQAFSESSTQQNYYQTYQPTHSDYMPMQQQQPQPQSDMNLAPYNVSYAESGEQTLASSDRPRYVSLYRFSRERDANNSTTYRSRSPLDESNLTHEKRGSSRDWRY